MNDLPDKEALLEAVTVFLASQVAPAIADRGLRFRVQIAAHLLQIVYRELQLGAAHHTAEIARLSALLGDTVPPDPDQDLGALRAALVAQIADPQTSPEALRAIQDAVVAGLIDQLAVSQPRFRTDPHIESPG